MLHLAKVVVQQRYNDVIPLENNFYYQQEFDGEDWSWLSGLAYGMLDTYALYSESCSNRWSAPVIQLYTWNEDYWQYRAEILTDIRGYYDMYMKSPSIAATVKFWNPNLKHRGHKYLIGFTELNTLGGAIDESWWAVLNSFASGIVYQVPSFSGGAVHGLWSRKNGFTPASLFQPQWILSSRRTRAPTE